MSIQPKGGRGHIAPYQTTHLRVPTPIKEGLQIIVSNYKERVLSGQIDPTQEVNFNDVCLSDRTPSKDEAIEIAKKILKAKRSAKQSINKLLTALYGEEINL